MSEEVLSSSTSPNPDHRASRSAASNPPAQIEQAARQLGIESAHVLVAVSGGCDSVALLRGLLELKQSLSLELIVAHFNHGWRGDEAEADAAWVRDLAKSLELEFVAGFADEYSLPDGGSEESARQDRYDFLTRTALSQRCRFVAVGHTSDDQAETVLHHILRGTGLAGLRGIPPERPLDDEITLVRPLLEIPRGGLEEWLTRIGQDWRRDRSNSDSRFTRNRIRNELLPLLATEFNPQIRRVLTTLAQQSGEVSDFVRKLAADALTETVISATPDSVRLDADALSRLSPVVLRETLVLAWQQQNWPLQGMSFSHWEALAEVVSAGDAVTLPGDVDARRRGGMLVLRRGERQAESDDEGNSD